jgi:hypothetical protein
MKFNRNYLLTACLCSVSMALAGCQDSKYPLVVVTGKVTFDRGDCPASGNVTLQPLDIAKGLPKRPATGKFGVDGKYTVNAFNDIEGVLPGRYRVEVTCFSGAPDLSKPDPWGEVNYIADSYRPTELMIAEGSGSVVHDLDVPRRKKSPQ